MRQNERKDLPLKTPVKNILLLAWTGCWFYCVKTAAERMRKAPSAEPGPDGAMEESMWSIESILIFGVSLQLFAPNAAVMQT